MASLAQENQVSGLLVLWQRGMYRNILNEKDMLWEQLGTMANWEDQYMKLDRGHKEGTGRRIL